MGDVRDDGMRAGGRCRLRRCGGAAIFVVSVRRGAKELKVVAGYQALGAVEVTGVPPVVMRFEDVDDVALRNRQLIRLPAVVVKQHSRAGGTTCGGRSTPACASTEGTRALERGGCRAASSRHARGLRKQRIHGLPRQKRNSNNDNNDKVSAGMLLSAASRHANVQQTWTPATKWWTTFRQIPVRPACVDLR